MMINTIRGKSGLTQEGFAKKYNIPKRTLQDWEAGRRNPPDYLLDLLAFASACENINISAWTFSEYRSSADLGRYKLFRSKDEALSYAKALWAKKSDAEKKAYIDDPASEFYVADLPVRWDNERSEFMPDFSERTPVWDAIAGERRRKRT